MQQSSPSTGDSGLAISVHPTEFPLAILYHASSRSLPRRLPTSNGSYPCIQSSASQSLLLESYYPAYTYPIVLSVATTCLSAVSLSGKVQTELHWSQLLHCSCFCRFWIWWCFFLYITKLSLFPKTHHCPEVAEPLPFRGPSCLYPTRKDCVCMCTILAWARNTCWGPSSFWTSWQTYSCTDSMI